MSTTASVGYVPPNRFPQIYGFIGTFLALATVAIVLRLISRVKFNRIGWDDIAAVVAYIAFLGVIIANIVSLKYGFGKHIKDIRYAVTGVSMQKCIYVAQVCYPVAQLCIKLSILLFLSRVIPDTSKWRTRIWIIATFVVAQELAFGLTLALQCRPVSFFWNKRMKPPGRCINQNMFYYIDASVNIFTDVVILALPWLIFSGLPVDKRKKYALLAICSSGVFTLVASIVRLPFLHDISHTHDPTWTAVNIASWTIAELGSAITTASVPTIKPLASWIFPRFKLSSAGDSGYLSKDGSTGPYALQTIGSAPMRNYEELKGEGRATDAPLGDGESEEYILNEHGRVIRQIKPKRPSREIVEIV